MTTNAGDTHQGRRAALALLRLVVVMGLMRWFKRRAVQALRRRI